MNDQVHRPRQRAFRGRQRNPCHACRTSHIKCDKTKPACRNCVRRAIECVRGHEIEIPSSTALTLPRTPDDPFSNPDGIFSDIHAPMVPNMNSLWYWLDFNLHMSSQGSSWLGHLRPVWGDTLVSYEPSLISYTLFLVLRLQSKALGVNTDRFARQARLHVLQDLRALDKMTGPSLVAVAMMALVSVRDHDLISAQAHLHALKLLVQDVKLNVSEWLFIHGTDYRICSYLLVAPNLPFYLPPGTARNFALPIEEITAVHKMAANNAASLASMTGTDYLLVLQLFEGLHTAFRVSSIEGSPWGQIYTIGWHSLSWVGSCRKEPTTPNTRCKNILSLAFLLLAWRVADDYVPTEGLIQINILNHAKSQCRGTDSGIMTGWPIETSFEPLLWAISVFSLESSRFRIDDQAYWTTQLHSVAHICGISTLNRIQAFIERWPYPSKWFDSIDQRLWRAIRLSESEVNEILDKIVESASNLSIDAHATSSNSPLIL